MIGVHFHEVEQFLDELDLHAEDDDVAIERGIVRVTPLYRTQLAGVRGVYVAASFVSTRRDALPELVHVDAAVGTMWGNPDHDEQTEERRDSMLAAIEAACERHGLERRLGQHEARIS